MVTIPLAWFREYSACHEQVQVLEDQWGETIPLTKESLSWAASRELDLDWFGRYYLRGAAREEYSQRAMKLRVAYADKMALLWIFYPRMGAPLLGEFWGRCEAPLKAEYNQQIADLLWAIVREDGA